MPMTKEQKAIYVQMGKKGERIFRGPGALAGQPFVVRKHPRFPMSLRFGGFSRLIGCGVGLFSGGRPGRLRGAAAGPLRPGPAGRHDQLRGGGRAV